MAGSTETAYHPKGDFFNLKGNHTNVRTEVGAGLTTFFAMAYIIVVNPNMEKFYGVCAQGLFVSLLFFKWHSIPFYMMHHKPSAIHPVDSPVF